MRRANVAPTNFLSADFLHTLSEEELHAAYVVRRAGLKLCDCSQRSFLSLGHGNFTSQDCAADVWQVLQLTKTDGPDTQGDPSGAGRLASTQMGPRRSGLGAGRGAVYPSA